MREQVRKLPRDGVLAAAVVALVMAIYAPALGGGFVFDDQALIERHPDVVQMAPLGRYFGQMFWANPEFDESPAFYRPLVILSYAVQHAVSGPNPLAYHLWNVLLHALNAVLLFALCRRVGADAAASLLYALLFASLPRLSESVAWVSGRTDLSAGLAILAALLLHDSAPRSAGRRVAAACALCAGLFAKEVALAGVAALVAIEAWRVRAGHQPASRAARNLAAATGAVAFYAAVRSWAWSNGGSRMIAEAPLPLAERPAAALQALGHYVAMTLDPLRPRVLIGVLGETDALHLALGAVGALALGAAGFLWLRRSSGAAAAGGGALVAAGLLPVLHLVPIAGQVSAADRYLYVPAIGLALLAAVASVRLPSRTRHVAAGLALAAFAAFAFTTTRRAAIWGDELLFWETAVAEAPATLGVAHAGLGETLFRHERPAEALAAFEEAARRLHARRPDALLPENVAGNMALCLAQLGRHAEAAQLLEGVVRARPDTPLHHYNLGLVRAQMLDFDAAQRELDAALALYPDYPRARSLAAAVARSRAEWEALPAPREDEPSAVKAARAHLYARLGNGTAAERLWRAVVAAPDARTEDLHRAAVYLVVWGDPDAAAAAIGRLRGVPALRSRVEELDQALAERRSAG